LFSSAVDIFISPTTQSSAAQQQGSLLLLPMFFPFLPPILTPADELVFQSACWVAVAAEGGHSNKKQCHC
jgi:hypothetical protein